MTIPEGFRLGDGWDLFDRQRTCDGGAEGHGQAEDVDCWRQAAYQHNSGELVCSEGAVGIGALVPVAPVVEAPRPTGGLPTRETEAMELLNQAWHFFDTDRHPSKDWVDRACMVVALRSSDAALATAEQRAAAAEDKLKKIDAEVSSSEERDCRCEPGGRTACLVCRIADILREGT